MDRIDQKQGLRTHEPEKKFNNHIPQVDDFE